MRFKNIKVRFFKSGFTIPYKIDRSKKFKKLNLNEFSSSTSPQNLPQIFPNNSLNFTRKKGRRETFAKRIMNETSLDCPFRDRPFKRMEKKENFSLRALKLNFIHFSHTIKEKGRRRKKFDNLRAKSTDHCGEMEKISLNNKILPSHDGLGYTQEGKVSSSISSQQRD